MDGAAFPGGMAENRHDLPAPLLAGFECGRLHWNGHDLLDSTRHHPHDLMPHHYATAAAEGAAGARDGLSWRHDPVARVNAVPAGFPVIWDLCHFDLPPRPRAHAIACAAALPDGAWAIAVNEPSVGRRVAGITRGKAVTAAMQMMTAAAMLPRRPRFATCDPFHHLHPQVFAATDRLVATGLVEMVGINYYPQHAVEPLHRVLEAVHHRYRLPVLIAETGWHDGLPAAHRRFPQIRHRWDWLAHVAGEVRRAAVPVAGICWYPWLDMPDWGHPHERPRWPCGWPGRQA